MKKAIFLVSFILFLAGSGLITAAAQDQPKPQKDTVNIDTDAKPTFYYDVEEEKSSSEGTGSAGTVAIIAGTVIVVGVAGYFLLKRKK